MFNDNENCEFDDGSQPYVEILLRKLDDPFFGLDWLGGGMVSSDGPCVTVEWPDANYVQRLSVRVVMKRWSYEFECVGPEARMSGSFPMSARESIERIENMVIDIAGRNIIEKVGEAHAAALAQAINEAKNLPTKETSLDDMPDHVIAEAARQARLKRGKAE